MPESPEKDEFAGYLRSAVSKLNEWMIPAKKEQRSLVRTISGLLYGLGVVVLIAVYGIVGVENTWATSLTGVLFGCGIAALRDASASFVQRVAASREEVWGREARMSGFLLPPQSDSR